MEIGRAPSQAAKNRAFDFADMVEPAIDQRLAEVGCGLAVAGCQTRSRVLSAHSDLWQVIYIQAAQVQRAVGRVQIAGPNVQRCGEGMIANIRRVVASATGSLKRRNATANQPAGGQVVVDSGDSAYGNLQTVEKLLPASDRLSCGTVRLALAGTILRPMTVQVEDVGSELAIARGHKSPGLLECGQQRVNAGIDADEERLSGDWFGPALGAI